jgi:hypothetical protein
VNRYVFLALSFALLGGGIVAHAQTAGGNQTPDPAFLQKAVQALQTQRNNEADQRAVAEARAAMLQDEVTKLQKDLAEARKPKEEPAK